MNQTGNDCVNIGIYSDCVLVFNSGLCLCLPPWIHGEQLLPPPTLFWARNRFTFNRLKPQFYAHVMWRVCEWSEDWRLPVTITFTHQQQWTRSVINTKYYMLGALSCAPNEMPPTFYLCVYVNSRLLLLEEQRYRLPLHRPGMARHTWVDNRCQCCGLNWARAFQCRGKLLGTKVWMAPAHVGVHMRERQVNQNNRIASVRGMWNLVSVWVCFTYGTWLSANATRYIEFNAESLKDMPRQAY